MKILDSSFNQTAELNPSAGTVSTYGVHVTLNPSTGIGIVSFQGHSSTATRFRRFNARTGAWVDGATLTTGDNATTSFPVLQRHTPLPKNSKPSLASRSTELVVEQSATLAVVSIRGAKQPITFYVE